MRCRCAPSFVPRPSHLRKSLVLTACAPPVYVPLLGISSRRLLYHEISPSSRVKERTNGAESSLYTRLVRCLQWYKKKDTYPQDPYAFLGVFDVFQVFVSLPTKRSKVSIFPTISQKCNRILQNLKNIGTCACSQYQAFPQMRRPGDEANVYQALFQG